MREVLARPRYEVIPTRGTDEWMGDLPEGAKVTVTCSPAQGIESTLRLAGRLAKRGFRVVPHLSARLVADGAHLEEIIGRLGELEVKEVFVVGGDARKPVGAYSSALELLRAMAGLGHGFEEIGVSGYPEGHPLIDDEDLDRALLDKQSFATYIVTQMCFDSREILNWVAGIRERGVRLPVYVGAPGAVDRKKLLRISLKIGVGDSARFLSKNTGLVASLFRSGSYSPDGLVNELAPYIGDRDYGIAGFHFFTFNQVESTEGWRRQVLDPGYGDAAPRREGARGDLP